MRFNMNRPCVDCPFLKGSSTNVSLAEGRIEEIVKDIRNDHTFTCHKTLEKPSRDQEHCGGALIFLEREDRPNQMMRIAERIRVYDRFRLKMDFPNLIENEEY